MDPYICRVLMRDLAGHDRKPSAFLVYLYLSCEAEGKPAALSLQEISDATGLSKRTVQESRKILVRRKLLSVARKGATGVPVYTVKQPWRKA